MVDDADFEFLNQWRWYAHKSRDTFYAVRTPVIDGKQVTIKMHRLILGLTDPSIHGDHRDLNGLNNQRCNLRACTHAENRRNSKLQSNSTTGFKGVSLYKRYNKFRAQIEIHGKGKTLGYFESAIDAAKAYNEAAKKYHGEFARINDV